MVSMMTFRSVERSKQKLSQGPKLFHPLEKNRIVWKCVSLYSDRLIPFGRITDFAGYAGLAVEEETNQTPIFKKEETSSTQAPPQVHRKISRVSSVPFIQAPEQPVVDVGDLMESCELAELSNHVPLENLASPKELKRNVSSEEDSWDKLYNETGDLLRPDAIDEVKLIT